LFLLIVISAALLFTSCESWKKDPRFIGDWQFSEKITADNLVYNTTRTLKLTKNTYEETFVIQRENSPSISAIIGTRGNLGLTHTNLILPSKRSEPVLWMIQKPVRRMFCGMEREHNTGQIIYHSSKELLLGL